jgi:hypothetical protein
MIQDYHLQTHHFQESNWRIQSIMEIWIVYVFIFKAGTHSTALSQYISVPAKSGITIIKWHTLPVLMAIWNGVRVTNESAGCVHLDVCGTKLRSFGPKQGNGQSVTVPVLTSNNMLLLQPPLWTAQEQVDMWMLSSGGNMSVAREMLPRQSR